MIKPLSSLATPPHTPTKPTRTASIPSTTPLPATLSIPVVVGAPLALSVSSSSSARTIVKEKHLSGIQSLQRPASPSTTLTPTKKLSNAIGSLLRRKKSVAPNSGARNSMNSLSLIGTGKVNEKEEEKVLRETQKKEATKESKKFIPAPVSSVKKRVLEIEAEEATKLREVKTSNGDDVIITTNSSNSRMGSLSEGSKKSPIAITQEFLPVVTSSESSKVNNTVLIPIHQDSSGSTNLSSIRPQSDGDISPRSPDIMSFPRSPSESTIIPLPSTFNPSNSSHLQLVEEKEGEATRLGSFSSTTSADTATSFQTADSHYE